jgi:DNA invertase Pin-like site-specific DNA recombinase
MAAPFIPAPLVAAPKPKAYSYIRLSSTPQLRGDSVRRQLKLSRDYADENDLDLDETFRDLGVSARKGKNRLEGALSEFVARIDSGEIKPGSYLLVESLDRLSREEVLVALEFFLSIIRRGVKVVTLIDRQIFDTDTLKQNIGLLYLSIGVMQRAYEESATKVRRVSEAREEARRRARDYKTPMTAKAHAWLRLTEQRTWQCVPKFVAVVNRIFAEADSGLGNIRITRHLIEDGKRDPTLAPTLSGKSHWNRSSVQSILTDQAVIGYFQPHKMVNGKRVPVGEPIADYYPVIVEPALFWRVQEIRRERLRHKGGTKGRNPRNVFTKIIFCETCSGPVYFIDKGEGVKGGQHYRCNGAVFGLCDNHKYFPYPALFSTVCELYETNISRILKERPLADETGRITELQAQIAQKQAFRKRLLDDLERDPDDDELHLRSRESRVEIRKLEQELVGVRRQIGSDQRLHSKGYFEEWSEALSKITSEDKRVQELALGQLEVAFKRIIERVTLRRDRSVILRMKQNPEGYCAEYDILSDGTIQVMRAVGPDGFTITLTRDAIVALDKPLHPGPIPNASALSIEDYQQARYGSFEERSKQVKVIRLHNRNWKVVPAKAA